MQKVIVYMIVVLAAFSTACIEQAGEELETPTGTIDQEVVGFVNYGNPEIGLLAQLASATSPGGFCTGTAVAPNVVLTAGHCVRIANYFFTFQSQTATPQRFDVRGRWASPTHDIGLVWLWQPVPATRPIKQHVPANSVAAVYGFGGNHCEPNQAGEWTLNDGILVKRITFFTTSGTSNLINAPLICGGDSGGPIIDWNDGIIFGATATSSGSQPGDIGTFTPTSTQWPELNFVIFVWQATSNQGG